jgi:Xaa-Pro dipeptidase
MKQDDTENRSSIGRRDFLKSSASAVLVGSAASPAQALGSGERTRRATNTLTDLTESGVFFPRDDYLSRWVRVQAAMAAADVEVLLVWQRSGGTYDKLSDVYWLTNFHTFGTGQGPANEYAEPYTFSAVLIRRGRQPEVHVGLPKEAFDVSRVVCGKLISHQPNLLIGLAEYMRSEGIEGRVTVVGDDVLPGMYDRMLRSYTPQIEWVADEELLVGPQLLKSPRELEVIRAAGSLVTDALSSAFEALIAGERACDAAARAASTLIRGGGGFHRIDITHGPADRPFYLSRGFYGYDTSAPEPGDLVSIWIYGPIFAGYWLDPGRTGICGNRPSSAQKALLEDCVKIVDKVVQLSVPGRTAREVGAQSAEFARELGYFEHGGEEGSGLFGHTCGTTLGPVIIPDGNTDTGLVGIKTMKGPIEPGMVLASEAFLERPGVGTAAFENNFIVTEKGAEILDRTPMLFW